MLWDVVIDLNSITSRHPFCRLCVPKERYIFFDVEQRVSVSNYKTAAASLPHRRRVFRLSRGHQRVCGPGVEEGQPVGKFKFYSSINWAQAKNEAFRPHDIHACAILYIEG